MDPQLAERITQLAGDGADAISRRLAELDRESDTERILEQAAQRAAYRSTKSVSHAEWISR